MCGRYSLVGETLDKQALDEIREFIGTESEFGNRFNIAPSQKAPVIRLMDGKPILQELTWNFRPEWLKNKNDAQRNARAETLFFSRMFKHSAAKRRCLVPATGWYEWQKVTGGTRPYNFHMTDHPLILFAGIWTRWADTDGKTDDSFAIITTSPNVLSAPIHNRMPVILTGDARRAWLMDTVNQPSDVDHLQDLLQPYAGTNLDAYPVNSYVGNPRNIGPQCLEPAQR